MSAPAASFADSLRSRYTLERELGRGGMATVYLARDLKHNRAVALKVLHPELAQALGPARFQREIEIVARLQHPHILSIHDSGETAGCLWFTMPYVEGESLRSRLSRENQLPLDHALRIAVEVARALDYAHRQGIVHRDIKPENILLSDDQALVADFGIAKALESEGGERLTETGFSLGTPAYMSPEQAGAGSVDGRADIYSLGCVLYEMLAGQPPFTGSSPRAIMARHAVDPVPAIRTVRPAVPLHVERAINRALQKVPADRFPTVVHFGRALEDGVQEETSRPHWAMTLTRARRSTWIAFALLAGFAAAAVAIWRSRGPPKPVLDPNLVAVAPFDVLDPKLALWHEGLVDVLARTIDGLGPLRTVSPTVALRRWAGRADSRSAQDLGRRTGARLAIFGQLVALSGDSVRLSATLVDVATGVRRSDFERSDRAGRLSSLADSLSLAILRDLGLSARGPVHLASVGTTSIVALKAFLQGEQHFRRGALDSAIAYFERAISLDTTFALAFRRLGLAHGWKADVSSTPFILRAGRLNRGLSPRDSLLITADYLDASARDSFTDDLLDSATRSPLEKRRFQTLETASWSYPGDPEVWYQLGEAREHNGYEAGATVAQALDAFDRSIALDSTFAEAYVHPIERTLHRGDCRRALTYLRPAAALNLAPENMPAVPAAAPVLTRLLGPTGVRPAEIQPILDTLSDEMLKDVAWMLRHCADSAETDIRLARQLVAPRPGRAKMAYPRDANNTLALSLANHGHLREAYKVLQRQPIVADGSAFTLIQLALLGAVPKDTAEMLFHRWLRGPDAELAMFTLPWWASQGDTSSVQAAITRADATLSARPDNPVARDAAEIGPMYLALARHDTVEVLRRLPGLPQWSDVPLLRARLLVAQRRDSAAAAWLEWHGSEGPLNVLRRLEQARVVERLGERDDAVTSYRFVIDMWRHPDPELLPYVTEARAALVRLTGESMP